MPGLFDTLTKADDRANIYYGLKNIPNWWNKDIGRTNHAKYKLSGLPFVGDYLRNEDYEKYWNDYFTNRGLSWDDVKYPTLMTGSGTAMRIVTGVWSTNPVSLKRLYD